MTRLPLIIPIDFRPIRVTRKAQKTFLLTGGYNGLEAEVLFGLTSLLDRVSLGGKSRFLKAFLVMTTRPSRPPVSWFMPPIPII